MADFKEGDEVVRQNDHDLIGVIKSFSPDRVYALVAWTSDQGRVFHRVVACRRLRYKSTFAKSKA